MEKQETISVFSSFLIFLFPCLCGERNFSYLCSLFFFSFSFFNPYSLFVFLSSSKDTFSSFLLSFSLYTSLCFFVFFLIGIHINKKENNKPHPSFSIARVRFLVLLIQFLDISGMRVLVSEYRKYTFLFIFLSI